jgi:hypothetical protein
MQSSTRTALYVVVAIAIIGFLSYSIPQIIQNLQGTVLYSYEYGYDYEYAYDDPRYGSNPASLVPVQALLTASGTQLGPIAGVPTTFILSVKNKGNRPVPLRAVNYVFQINHTIGNVSFELTSPTAPLNQTSNNVHIYGMMANEAANYENNGNTSIINYLASDDTLVLGPGDEITLFSFTGSFTGPIDANYTNNTPAVFQYVTAEHYFHRANIVNGQILPPFNAEFTISGQNVTTTVRQDEYDTSGPLGIPDQNVNENDMFQILRNWRE